VTGVKSSSTRDPLVQVETAHTHEASVCDVAVVLGCTKAIDRNVVCDLLT
jgi:hypothetical protein